MPQVAIPSCVVRGGIGERYADPEVTIRHYDEVLFDGWSLLAVDTQGEVIAANTPPAHNPQRRQAILARVREEIARGHVRETGSDPYALLPTMRHGNYYHFLADDLARLGLYDVLPQADSLRFPVPHPTPWQRECYVGMGIADRLVPLGKALYRLRDVWVAPRGLASIQSPRSRAFDALSRLPTGLGLSCDPIASRRIFVTRDRTRHRRLHNEADVQALALDYDFMVVRPETLSVVEQIGLFREAWVVLGVFGAGLTNAVFMQPGATLLEIAPPCDAPPTVHNAIFSAICGLRGLRYEVVAGQTGSYDTTSQDFTASLEWLGRALGQHL